MSDAEVNKANLLLPHWAYILTVNIEKNQIKLSNKASYCKSSQALERGQHSPDMENNDNSI